MAFRFVHATTPDLRNGFGLNEFLGGQLLRALACPPNGEACEAWG